MKKIIASILVGIMFFSCGVSVASAQVGDVIDVALHTDIFVYINGYPIPSYAVSGQSVIVAEDLRNFGFDVTWNQGDRSLTITRNDSFDVTPMYVEKNHTTGEIFTNILETDIVVRANGQVVTSYAMNGYTMVPVEELTMLGAVTWMPEERALHLKVESLYNNYFTDGIGVAYACYANTSVPNYGWVMKKAFTYEHINDYDGMTEISAAYGDESYKNQYENIQTYVEYLLKQGWRVKAEEHNLDHYYVTYLMENPDMQCMMYIETSGSGGVCIEATIYKTKI